MDEKKLSEIDARLEKMMDIDIVDEYIRLSRQRELFLDKMKDDSMVQYACGVNVAIETPGLSMEIVSRREYDFTDEFKEYLLRTNPKALKVNVTELNEDNLKRCKGMLKSTKQSVKLTDKTAYMQKLKGKVKEVRL